MKVALLFEGRDTADAEQTAGMLNTRAKLGLAVLQREHGKSWLLCCPQEFSLFHLARPVLEVLRIEFHRLTGHNPEVFIQLSEGSDFISREEIIVLLEQRLKSKQEEIDLMMDQLKAYRSAQSSATP